MEPLEFNDVVFHVTDKKHDFSNDLKTYLDQNKNKYVEDFNQIDNAIVVTFGTKGE